MNTTTEAARYGNLALVAINFHVQTGSPTELDAAYWYTRYAVRAADGAESCWCGCGSRQHHQEPVEELNP